MNTPDDDDVESLSDLKTFIITDEGVLKKHNVVIPSDDNINHEFYKWPDINNDAKNVYVSDIFECGESYRTPPDLMVIDKKNHGFVEYGISSAGKSFDEYDDFNTYIEENSISETFQTKKYYSRCFMFKMSKERYNETIDFFTTKIDSVERLKTSFVTIGKSVFNKYLCVGVIFYQVNRKLLSTIEDKFKSLGWFDIIGVKVNNLVADFYDSLDVNGYVWQLKPENRPLSAIERGILSAYLKKKKKIVVRC